MISPGSIPGISAVVHANKKAFFLRNSMLLISLVLCMYEIFYSNLHPPD